MGSEDDRLPPFTSLVSPNVDLDRIGFLVGLRHEGLTGLEARDNEFSGRLDECRAASYRRKLESLRSNDLHEFFLAEKEKAEAELEADLFFHGPDARADFSHYCKASCWEPDECVALSFGKDPKIVSIGTVHRYVKVSEFARQYERRHYLCVRAVRSGDLPELIKPAIFANWAKGRLIELPSSLVRGLEEHGRGSKRSAALVTEEDLGPKEIQSLLKLVAGLSIAGYKFDPRQARNDATNEIKTDLRRLGVKLDDGTILKFLRLGGELVPPQKLEEVLAKANSPKR